MNGEQIIDEIRKWIEGPADLEERIEFSNALFLIRSKVESNIKGLKDKAVILSKKPKNR